MTYLLPDPPIPWWNKKPAIIVHMDEEKPVKKAAKKAPAKKAAAKKAPAKLVDEAKKPEPEVSAADVITSGAPKFLVFMKRGASYSTFSGVTFNKAHPYQLVEFDEKETLLAMPEDRFREATPEEAKDYYKK